MALFSDRRNSASEKASGTEPAVQLSFVHIISLICIFGFCLSYLLSAAIVAGRFIEYRVPLFLMDLPIGIVFGMACSLFLAVLAGLILQRSLSEDGTAKSILSKSQKISYFFSLLTTLCFTVYVCAALMHFLKTEQFLSECIYLLFLYVCVLLVHLKPGKTSLAHIFTSAAFVLILIVTAFYGGIASAKIENKKIAYINSETFAFVSAQAQNYILVGFDTNLNKSNGKVVVLPKDSSVLENTVFFPLKMKR